MRFKVNTKEIFMKALLDLSKEKNIEKITVQNLLDYTGAARQTFYKYFRDKYDLINYVYHYNVESIFQEYYETMDLYECIYKVYEFFIVNKQYFKHISIIECQNNFKDYLFENTRKFYINTIKKQYGEDEINYRLSYIIDSTCYGAVGLCMDWIKSDINKQPEKIASKIVDCIHPEIKKYFNESCLNK